MKVHAASAAPGVGSAERRRFYEALQRLLRIYQFRDRDVACYGSVSPDECYALEAIEGEEAMRVGDLAAALNLHKSNASRLASALEAKGFVARSMDRGDGRAVRLRITPRGRTVHAAIRARVENVHAEILAAYAPAIRAAMTRLLEELADEAAVRVGGRKLASGTACTQRGAKETGDRACG
jgi:DNA-binding MarR family transcriptional regulator